MFLQEPLLGHDQPAKSEAHRTAFLEDTYNLFFKKQLAATTDLSLA